MRAHVARLTSAGLDAGEALLVALTREASHDAPSRDFAREHLFGAETSRDRDRPDTIIAFCLAVAAAALIKAPALFGIDMSHHVGFYARNASLFVLPLVAGYFAWKRRLGSSALRWIVTAFAAAAGFANVYPFAQGGATEVLTALHLPIALWLLVGIAHAGGRWGHVDGRMDFIRFTGELFIYYVLIALGGGVFTAFMAMIFESIGMRVEPFFASWILPCGAAGAIVIASWLAEARRDVVENTAPVLTRLFTPLFAALLVVFLVTLLVTGRGIAVERNVLIAFDLLLVVVLGLLLYSISARDPQAPPGVFDVLQLVLLVSALLADAVALWAIAARISEFGFTPNRVAALGENVILLVNLAWSAALSARFLRGRCAFSLLERWQTNYVPIYAVWAAIVVVVFPVVFGYA